MLHRGEWNEKLPDVTRIQYVGGSGSGASIIRDNKQDQCLPQILPCCQFSGCSTVHILPNVERDSHNAGIDILIVPRAFVCRPACACSQACFYWKDIAAAPWTEASSRHRQPSPTAQEPPMAPSVSSFETIWLHHALQHGRAAAHHIVHPQERA